MLSKLKLKRAYLKRKQQQTTNNKVIAYVESEVKRFFENEIDEIVQSHLIGGVPVPRISYLDCDVFKIYDDGVKHKRIPEIKRHEERDHLLTHKIDKQRVIADYFKRSDLVKPRNKTIEAFGDVRFDFVEAGS